ncbi:hypothetical protein ACLOJK_017009 [Asimina triloba]
MLLPPSLFLSVSSPPVVLVFPSGGDGRIYSPYTVDGSSCRYFDCICIRFTTTPIAVESFSDLRRSSRGQHFIGGVWTATAHVVTAVIGSGVLSLAWSVAQLGWILGPTVLLVFALVTYYTAVLLSDCYRSPDPINGSRNYTYMEAVKACLGKTDVVVCGIAQYTSLWTTLVGYTNAAAVSMKSVKLANCYRLKGQGANCTASVNMFMVIFGAMEIVLSQLPSLEKVTLLSVLAAAMSFTYSFIGLFLCARRLEHNHEVRGSITGAMAGMSGVSKTTSVWYAFQALGNVAFAYSYSMIQVEIQDTLKSPPPENKTMRRAAMYGIGSTTLFYVTIGCIGYAAFGNTAPGNLLTEFYEPFWLVHIANLALVIHLVGAYQVYGQPFYAFCEKWLLKKWPSARFLHNVHSFRLVVPRPTTFRFTLCKLLLRTIIVAVTTLVSVALPFFNSIVGFNGAISFWPLTVYFPIRMYMVQTKVTIGCPKWWFLQCFSIVCLLVTVVATVGSVADIVQNLKHVELF